MILCRFISKHFRLIPNLFCRDSRSNLREVWLVLVNPQWGSSPLSSARYTWLENAEFQSKMPCSLNYIRATVHRVGPKLVQLDLSATLTYSWLIPVRGSTGTESSKWVCSTLQSVDWSSAVTSVLHESTKHQWDKPLWLWYRMSSPEILLVFQPDSVPKAGLSVTFTVFLVASAISNNCW